MRKRARDLDDDEYQLYYQCFDAIREIDDQMTRFRFSRQITAPENMNYEYLYDKLADIKRAVNTTG